MREQIKEDNLNQLISAIADQEPKSLDDIIRKNRASFQIRLATELDILGRQAYVDASNPKDVVDNWTLITMVGKDKKTFLRLIGEFRSSKKIKITSNIFAIDVNQ